MGVNMTLKLVLVGVLAGLLSVSANAQSRNYSKRIVVAQGCEWSLCTSSYSNRNDCYVVPAQQVCPDGYGKGGICWATKAEACSTPTTACAGGRHGC
jgi:hypothetical protein